MQGHGEVVVGCRQPGFASNRTATGLLGFRVPVQGNQGKGTADIGNGRIGTGLGGGLEGRKGLLMTSPFPEPGAVREQGRSTRQGRLPYSARQPWCRGWTRGGCL
jgi:hypothetical protein